MDKVEGFIGGVIQSSAADFHPLNLYNANLQNCLPMLSQQHLVGLKYTHT